MRVVRPVLVGVPVTVVIGAVMVLVVVTLAAMRVPLEPLALARRVPAHPVQRHELDRQGVRGRACRSLRASHGVKRERSVQNTTPSLASIAAASDGRNAW